MTKSLNCSKLSNKLKHHAVTIVSALALPTLTQAAIIPSELPDTSYITNGELDWTWASPVNEEIFGTNILKPPSFHTGWRYATQDELNDLLPAYTSFLRGDSSVIQSVQYWNTSFTHVDTGDYIAGLVSSSWGKGTWETVYVRNAYLTPNTSGQLFLNGSSQVWHDRNWQFSTPSYSVFWKDSCDARLIGSGSSYRIDLGSPITVRDMSFTNGQLQISSMGNTITFTDPGDGVSTVNIDSGSLLMFNAPVHATGSLAQIASGTLEFNSSLTVINSLMLQSGSTVINNIATIYNETVVSGDLTVNGSLTSGDLQIENNGNTVVNGTTTIMDNTTVSGDLTVDGSLTSGDLQIENSGNTVVNGTTTITDNTTVGGNLTVNGSLTSGDLQIENSGNTVVNGSTTIANNTAVGGDLTVNGLLTSGSLDIESSGNTTVNGTTTITDNTSVSGDLTVDGSLTNGSLDIESSGNTVVNGTTTIAENTSVGGELTVDGSLTSGSLDIESSGNTVVNGTTTIAENTAVDGDLTVNGSLTSGSLDIESSGNTVVNGTTTIAENTAVDGDLTVNGSLTSGSLDIESSGNTTVNGTTTIAENTSVSGDLTVNGSLTSGSLDIENRGHTAVNGSATIAENTSVGGELTVNGSLTSGDLQIENSGNTVVNGTATITDNTSVSGDLTVNGRMDTGSLGVTNSGSVQVNGRLSAGTTVNYGLLNINGTLDSPVANYGFLGGSGRIADSVYNQKVISPGNSIGTLTINGSYTHGSGATFIAETDNNGKSDLLNVTGSATLKGGTVSTNLQRGLYTDGYSWTFLQASGGLTGQFASLIGQPDSNTLRLSLGYDSSKASIQVNRQSYSTFAKSKGAESMGRALDKIVPYAVSKGDAMENLLVAMDFDYSNTDITNTLSALNPELYPTFLAIKQQATLRFSQNMFQRNSQVRDFNKFDINVILNKQEVKIPHAKGGELTARSQDADWVVWGKAQGSSAFKDHSEYNGYDFRTGGAVLGADTELLPLVRLGGAIAFETTDIEWKQGADGTQDNIMLGAYASGNYDNYYLDIQGSVGFYDNNSNRVVSFANYTSRENADFNGQSYSASVGGGYDFDHEKWLIGPSASLSYMYLRTNDFSESGNNTFSLNVEDSSENVFVSYLGAHAASIYQMDETAITTRIDIGWQHNFQGDIFEMSGSFKGYPSFTFSGPGLDQDMLLAVAETTISFSDQLSAHLDLGGGVGNDTKTYNISVGLQWRF